MVTPGLSTLVAFSCRYFHSYEIKINRRDAEDAEVNAE